MSNSDPVARGAGTAAGETGEPPEPESTGPCEYASNCLSYSSWNSFLQRRIVVVVQQPLHAVNDIVPLEFFPDQPSVKGNFLFHLLSRQRITCLPFIVSLRFVYS